MPQKQNKFKNEYAGSLSYNQIKTTNNPNPNNNNLIWKYLRFQIHFCVVSDKISR